MRNLERKDSLIIAKVLNFRKNEMIKQLLQADEQAEKDIKKFKSGKTTKEKHDILMYEYGLLQIEIEHESYMIQETLFKVLAGLTKPNDIEIMYKIVEEEFKAWQDKLNKMPF